MNRFILIGVLILITNFCFSQDLKMELEIEKCIDTSTQNRVTFIVENPNEGDLWINPAYLTFYFGIYSKEGNPISRKTTQHIKGLETDYLKVEKKSKCKS